MNTGGSPRSLMQRFLGAAATLLVSVLLLRWTWQLTRPFLPWVLLGFLLAAIGKVWISYRRKRW